MSLRKDGKLRQDPTKPDKEAKLSKEAKALADEQPQQDGGTGNERNPHHRRTHTTAEEIRNDMLAD